MNSYKNDYILQLLEINDNFSDIFKNNNVYKFINRIDGIKKSIPVPINPLSEFQEKIKNFKNSIIRIPKINTYFLDNDKKIENTSSLNDISSRLNNLYENVDTSNINQNLYDDTNTCLDIINTNENYNNFDINNIDKSEETVKQVIVNNYHINFDANDSKTEYYKTLSTTTFSMLIFHNLYFIASNPSLYNLNEEQFKLIVDILSTIINFISLFKQ